MQTSTHTTTNGVTAHFFDGKCTMLEREIRDYEYAEYENAGWKILSNDCGVLKVFFICDNV